MVRSDWSRVRLVYDYAQGALPRKDHAFALLGLSIR